LKCTPFKTARSFKEYFIFVHLKSKDMKLIRFTLLLNVFVGLIFLSSCGPGSDPQPTIEGAQLEKLAISKGWVVSKAELDGVDYLTDYTGFKITITGTFTADGATYDYALIGRPVAIPATKPGLKSPWPKNSGKWKFGTPPASVIIRDPEDAALKQDITYTITADKLQLDFTYTGNGYSSKVAGAWHMEFTPAP
jgi:hypothetical protein